MNDKELSLEGILQAIANFRLEEDFDFDIIEVLKERDKILKKNGVNVDELGRLFDGRDKCLKK